jgi:kynurenine 3-monooxygenase
MWAPRSRVTVVPALEFRMANKSRARRIMVVGAGPAGALAAILFGRRGFEVDVYERREDPRPMDDAAVERRSINLGLSHRGITALRQAGVLEEVMAPAVRARGRVIHATDGRLTFQPYGTDEREILYSISRIALNRVLIAHAAALPGVRFHFGFRCESLDRDAAAAVFRDEEGREVRASADFIVGADGAYSTVREEMQEGTGADFFQETLPWGYKELLIPPAPEGGSRIELEALHIWPRGDALIVTHPNRDGSHTVTVFLPFEGGTGSFAELTTEAAVDAFFARVFPDLPALVPGLASEFLSHPTGTLVATRTAPWHHGDRVVLVGDACHAVYPFFGQGMNAALEDCLVLDRLLGEHGDDLRAAFRAYEAARRPNTDALLELVKGNFDELRSGADHPGFLARKKVDFLLHQLFPRRWIPLYTMVVHTTMPYAEALARQRRQERILRRLGVDAVLALAGNARRLVGPAARPRA